MVDRVMETGHVRFDNGGQGYQDLSVEIEVIKLWSEYCLYLGDVPEWTGSGAL